MFATMETTDFILCGVAAYFVVAATCILTGGLCAYLLRQRELAGPREAAAGGAATPPAPPAWAGEPAATTAPREVAVSTAA